MFDFVYREKKQKQSFNSILFVPILKKKIHDRLTSILNPMYIEQNVFTYFLLTSYYCFLLTTNTVPTIEITQKKKKN